MRCPGARLLQQLQASLRITVLHQQPAQRVDDIRAIRCQLIGALGILNTLGPASFMV